MEHKPEEYYLLLNGDTAGPYTLADLHAMWMDDKITLDTLFVRPGMQKCQPVNLILGLVINYDPSKPVEVEPEEEKAEHPLSPFRPLLRWGGSRSDSLLGGLGYSFLPGEDWAQCVNHAGSSPSEAGRLECF